MQPARKAANAKAKLGLNSFVALAKPEKGNSIVSRLKLTLYFYLWGSVISGLDRPRSQCCKHVKQSRQLFGLFASGERQNSAVRRTAARKFQKFENNSAGNIYFSRAGRNYFKSPAARHLSSEPVGQVGLPNDRSQSSAQLPGRLQRQRDLRRALYFGQAIATPPSPSPHPHSIHAVKFSPPNTDPLIMSALLMLFCHFRSGLRLGENCFVITVINGKLFWIEQLLKRIPKGCNKFWGTHIHTYIHVREGHARKDKLVRPNPSWAGLVMSFQIKRWLTKRKQKSWSNFHLAMQLSFTEKDQRRCRWLCCV